MTEPILNGEQAKKVLSDIEAGWRERIAEAEEAAAFERKARLEGEKHLQDVETEIEARIATCSTAIQQLGSMFPNGEIRHQRENPFARRDAYRTALSLLKKSSIAPITDAEKHDRAWEPGF